MLRRHFDYIERLLLAQSRVVADAGHPIHKGAPREYFIRSFLESHISGRAAFGTGEIIDADSEPSEDRNQIDIIIYSPDYPKLSLGGGIDVFIAESVIATIEVKSVLDEAGLKRSIKAANRVKQLKRNVSALTAGYRPPGIVSYVVAYDGPANIDTVYGWLGKIHNEEQIAIPKLPLTRQGRAKVLCPSVDSVFLLGKGFLYFDNMFTGYTSNPIHEENPDAKWIYADSADGNVCLLSLFLTDVISSYLASIPRLTPYLKASDVPLKWGG